MLSAGGGGLHGTLHQPGGGKVEMWLSQPPTAGAADRIYRAEGLGTDGDLNKRMPMLIQRRTANDTAFAAIYAPYWDTPQVRGAAFGFPSSSGREAVVNITHADGRDLVLSLPEPGVLEAEGAVLRGSFGCRSELAGGERLWMLEGTEWKDADLEVTLKTGGSLLVQAGADGGKIYNAADSTVEGTFRLKVKGQTVGKSFAIPPGMEMPY